MQGIEPDLSSSGRQAETAEAMGAKAVIGVRFSSFSSTQVSQGAVELIIYGTAVC